MIALEYQNLNNSSWPVSAAAGKNLLVFSGNFSQSRIQNEKLGSKLFTIAKILLWILVSIGILALALSIWQSFITGIWYFIILPAYSNLAFFISILAVFYLWALYKQQILDEEEINLLSFQTEEALGQPLDIYKLFNSQAKDAWNNSLRIAKSRTSSPFQIDLQKPEKQLEVTANDLILSLMETDSIKLVFWRLGVDSEDIITLIKNYSIFNPNNSNSGLNKTPFVAFVESLKLHNKSIDPLMLLCALCICLPEEHILQAIFFNLDLNLEKLEIIASWIFNLSLLSWNFKLFRKFSKYKPDNEINKALTSIPTFFLDRFSQDLTFLAKHARLPIALGRAQDLSEVFKLLSDGSKNLLIKGDPGTGRTTLINELAYKMDTDQVPKEWQDQRLVSLEISSIIGQPQKSEQIMLQCLKEAARSGNIILVIEDIHVLARTQGSSGLTLLELLIEFLQNRALTVIGTTSLGEYTDYLQPSANFDSVFTSYELTRLSREGIMLACCIRASLLEGKDKCFFQFQAIEQAVQMTDLYIKEGGQPQKAISILVEAANRAKNSERKVITPALIQKIISEKTHIPQNTFTQNEADKLLNLENELSKYIVGQKNAVTAVAEGLRRSRSGLSSIERPLSSFLFLGPTGVGKTEVARVLASKYFGEEKYLLRLDMSEFKGPEALEKLLGSPERKTDSPLIKHIKNFPFCLLLLDEFEKAGPEILNLFLQVLEDGRLTSGRGETLDLTHCLIIATSNAGTREIQEGIKAHKTLDQIKLSLFNQTLTNVFPPELLNRFDGIILFSPLSPEEIKKISRLQLESLKQNLLEKGIKAEFSENVVADIAKNAFDPTLGARPIRRYIQDHLEGFVAKLLLAKRLPRGSNILIDLEKGELVVK